MRDFSVLFVCMGNICRSPTAHGVFRHKVQQMGLASTIHVDSAGTHNYHPGSPPDDRAQKFARQRGYDLSDLRARKIRDEDFERFDLILVMDRDNFQWIEAHCPAQELHKVRRLTEFAQHHQHDIVPDPYYGGSAGFTLVLDLVEDACDGLLQHIQKTGA